MKSMRWLALGLVLYAGCVASEDTSRLTSGVPRSNPGSDGGAGGAGSDGTFDSGGNAPANNPVVLNRTRTTVVGSAGSTHVTVGNSMGFVPNNSVLLHDSQGAAAGHWELARIYAVAGNNITLTKALAHDYPATDHAQILVVPQYTDFTVRSGDNVTGPDWDGSTGGIIAFAASGTVTIAGSMYQSAAGFRGSNHNPGCPQTYQCMPGYSGESPTGPSQASSMPNGSGGGGGGMGECNEGGGGSYGGAGNSASGGGAASGCMSSGASPGVAGALVGDADLRATIFFGGAGGEGGADEDSIAPGHGGNGGGLIMIFAPQVTVTGRIDVSGDDGQDGAGNDRCGMGCGSGGGAGGAGGAIYFETQHLAISGSGSVTALGGKGGNCSCNGQGGGWHMPPMSYAPAGGGGVGRIAAHGATVTGTTNPPLVFD